MPTVEKYPGDTLLKYTAGVSACTAAPPSMATVCVHDPPG
jgi:hypothetical protein